MPQDLPKYHRPSDEFADVDLTTLGDACYRLSFELRLIDQPTRSPEERAALVDRAAGLLMHASAAIMPKPLMPHSPEYPLRYGGSVAQAFGDWMELLQRTVRYHVMRRAANYVLGADAMLWCRDQRGDDTDAGVMELLQKLDTIHHEKK